MRITCNLSFLFISFFLSFSIVWITGPNNKTLSSFSINRESAYLPITLLYADIFWSVAHSAHDRGFANNLIFQDESAGQFLLGILKRVSLAKRNISLSFFLFPLVNFGTWRLFFFEADIPFSSFTIRSREITFTASRGPFAFARKTAQNGIIINFILVKNNNDLFHISQGWQSNSAANYIFTS